LTSYSSGDTADSLWAIQRLEERLASSAVFGVGFSLGANVLLKLLADSGTDAPLRGAVAISTPFDLAACARVLDRDGWSLYRTLFLSSLKRKALEKARRYPDRLDVAAIRAARGIWAFDDAVTAPLYGFDDAAAYYAGCSSGPRLREIRVPTLLINAEDDPLVPPEVLPGAPFENPAVTVLRVPHGGHVGFMAGSLLRPRFWAEEQALRFLDGCALA
jgi:predicted alpha/beta-fold hydrolase